jgi:hypothetical protein
VAQRFRGRAPKSIAIHMVEGKRLEVNRSATRYQRELAYLLIGLSVESAFMKEAAN